MRTRHHARCWIAVCMSVFLGSCMAPERKISDDSTMGATGFVGTTNTELDETRTAPDPVSTLPSGSAASSGTGTTGGAAAPLPMSPSPASPPPPDKQLQQGETRDVFYNATLAPQLPRETATPERPVLRVNEKIRMAFDIGPKRANSETNDQPAPLILQSADDLSLTIMFGCDFCAPHDGFTQHIIYRPDERQSERIAFDFMPAQRKDGASYRDNLYLAIINGETGMPIDRVTIPVTVKSDSSATDHQRSDRSTALQLLQMSQFARRLKPDVTIYAAEVPGRAIVFGIEPVSAEMKTLLGPLATTKRGTPKSFRSGVMNVDAIDQDTVWSYEALKAFTLQQKTLAKLRATGNDSTISSQARTNLKFSNAEAANVSALIAATGQQLYQKFFYDSSDKTLRKIIALLEAAGAKSQRPLRVQIFTNGLNVSWQYLHPIGEDIEPQQFWGMRFSLSVQRLNDGAKTWRENPPGGDARKILFAHYGMGSDSSVRLAKAQINALKAALPKADVVPISAGTTLINTLKQQKNAIAGVVTFMHASAGANGVAPHLEFSTADRVEAADFADLRRKLSPADQDVRYLALGPLAILNACETGPALKLSQPKLTSELFRLGVRGVVVTEISVWETLGDDMAKRLFARLVKGENAADALTAARRELLEEKNNPLGLLYAYYGDLGATLLPASESDNGK